MNARGSGVDALSQSALRFGVGFGTPLGGQNCFSDTYSMFSLPPEGAEAQVDAPGYKNICISKACTEEFVQGAEWRHKK